MATPEVGQNDLLLSVRRAPPAGSAPDCWDWERLDRELRPRLVAQGIRRFGCTPEEAEDLVQDIFGTVWEKRPRVRHPEGYLVTTFLHRCIDRLEARSRTASRETCLEEVPPDHLAADRLVAVVHVRGALRRMTPICRALIRTICLGRVRLADVAAEKGCSVPAVWKRLDQCIRRMRTCLAA